MERVENERAIALIGVLVALVLLMGLAAILGVTVNLDTQIAGAYGRGVRGFYAAEGGLNKGMADAKNLFLNFEVPSGEQLGQKTLLLGDRTVNYKLTERPGNPRVVTIPAGELFAGLNAIEYTYIVDSEAIGGGAVEASVGAEFNVSNIPLFQFVAFYAEDLEILPGPTMVLNGRVHTNGDLYLNADTSLTIADKPAVGVSTIQVTAAGNIYRGRKNTTECKGTVTVDKLEDVEPPTPDFDPRTLPCIGGRRKVPVDELAAWKGSMVSQVQSINVPTPDLIVRGSGEFWERADLRIALMLGAPGRLCDPVTTCPDRSHSIVILAADGREDTIKTAYLRNFMRDVGWNGTNSSMPYTMPVFYTDVPKLGSCGCSDGSSDQTSCTSQARTCYAEAFPNDNRVYSSDMRVSNQFTEARRGGYYNYREKKWMYLLNVNMHDLLAWNSSHGEPLFDNDDRTDGGLVVFLTVVGPNANGINNYGVRVFGSANLPIPLNAADPTGLTVVSDQAMYVVGDYNRGAAGDLPKQPAALIGDSLNVMSTNWFRSGCTNNCQFNDRQSRNSDLGTNRVAATTTINAAFLAGVDRTGGINGPAGQNGAYNGGLENYPRFHERWSGVGLNYQGSFVSLGIPRHVNGRWSYGAPVYEAPNRNWNYDPDFNGVEKLPPLTPRFVYVRQVLFTQNFR